MRKKMRAMLAVSTALTLMLVAAGAPPPTGRKPSQLSRRRRPPRGDVAWDPSWPSGSCSIVGAVVVVGDRDDRPRALRFSRTGDEFSDPDAATSSIVKHLPVKKGEGKGRRWGRVGKKGEE